MRRYVRVIADGLETRIPARGRIIFIDSATAGVQVTLRKNDTGKGDGQTIGPITMQTGRKLSTAIVFDDVIIRNESGASNTVTVLIGEGDFDVSVATVSIEESTNITSTADATAAAVATSILAADSTRQRVHLQALPTNTENVRVGDSDITATRGALLSPGVGLTIEGSAEIFAIREASGTVQIAILTERIP